MKNNNNYFDYLLNTEICMNNNYKFNENKNLEDINYSNYYKYIDFNYTLKQLKNLAKKFNLNSSKNKDILKKNIFNFFFITKNSIIIQKNIRKFIVSCFIKLKGPGLLNRKQCNNECDFLTFDNLDTIMYKDFFSFNDDCDFVYGFHINSFYNYIIKSKNKNIIINPYNNLVINNKIITDFYKLLSYSKLLNYNCLIEDSKAINNNIDSKIIEIFLTIDSFGYNTSVSWFSNLEKINLIILIKELYDIWNYRANLSIKIKREISPPYGNPFISVDIHKLNNYNTYQIKNFIYNIFDNLVNKGVNHSSKSLGCLYILTALTIVSNDAAESMPWLFQSVNII
tara:strand:+ start:274 stop:1293 length:1020 start_codon:yes stop_codon:yes gene_type:complete